MLRTSRKIIAVRRLLVSLVAFAAIAGQPVASWARPEQPGPLKRVFYKTVQDRKTVVVDGRFFAPSGTLQVYYKCVSARGSFATVSIGGNFKKRGLPCDGKIHWLRNVSVDPGPNVFASLGVWSPGEATLSIWSRR